MSRLRLASSAFFAISLSVASLAAADILPLSPEPPAGVRTAASSGLDLVSLFTGPAAVLSSEVQAATLVAPLASVSIGSGQGDAGGLFPAPLSGGAFSFGIDVFKADFVGDDIGGAAPPVRIGGGSVYGVGSGAGPGRPDGELVIAPLPPAAFMGVAALVLVGLARRRLCGSST